jgi:ABC-type histidine transport system ATPase subunit
LRCINFLEQPNDGAMSLDGQAIRMVTDRHGMHVADPMNCNACARDWPWCSSTSTCGAT